MKTLQTNQIYMYYGRKSKGLNTVFYKYLGYSMNGKKCFEIFCRQKKGSALSYNSDTWINRNLLN